MNQHQQLANFGQINLLKNLDDIDDNLNDYIQDQESEQDFDDFLECFSDDEHDSIEEDSKNNHLPNFQQIQGTQYVTTGQDLEFTNKRQTENVLIQPNGDEQYPNIDNIQIDQYSDEDGEIPDLFDSFGEQNHENNKQNDKQVQFIEFQYFNETYKIPILSQRLFQQQQPLEERLMFYNTDLILSKHQLHDFYEHIQKILKQVNNVKIKKKDYKIIQNNFISSIVLGFQNQILLHLNEQFNKMQETQQKWLKLSPSIIGENQAKLFTLQLKSFQNSSQYIIDTNANKLTGRRYFDNQKPAYFKSQNKETKLDKLTEDKRILELQQIPFNQNFHHQSSLVSILYFKAVLLKELYSQFLHYKFNTEIYKEKIRKNIRKLKDSFIIKNKYLQNQIKYAHSSKIQNKTLSDINQVDMFWVDYKKFSKMKCLGLSQVLIEVNGLNYQKTFSRYQQLKCQKYLSEQYLQFNLQEFI